MVAAWLDDGSVAVVVGTVCPWHDWAAPDHRAADDCDRSCRGDTGRESLAGHVVACHRAVVNLDRPCTAHRRAAAAVARNCSNVAGPGTGVGPVGEAAPGRPDDRRARSPDPGADCVCACPVDWTDGASSIEQR